MHILLIHQAFAALDEPGGTRHDELARLFAGQGHRVTIIASPVSYLTGKAQDERVQWKAVEHEVDGVTIFRTYTYPALHKSFFHRVISFLSFMFSSFVVGLSVKDVDVVWGTSPPIFQGFTAWLLAWLKRVPFLFEVRDLWPAFAVAMGVLRNPILIKASEWLERFLYRKADRIVVNSPGFISHIREHEVQPISLIPNGADVKMFNPDAMGEAFRQRHHLEDKFIVLYAGAHGISNDLGVLLDGAEKLQNYQEIVFVLIGAGKEKHNLVQMAKRKNLGNVIFLPPVSKRSMSEVLAAANVCVAILKPIDMYKTVYPNKVFDYMAAGRPVILAIDGVIKEVVIGAGAGIYVKPGDSAMLSKAVLELYQDQNRAKEMGLKGRHEVEKRFNRSVLASEFLDVFTEVIKQ